MFHYEAIDGEWGTLSGCGLSLEEVVEFIDNAKDYVIAVEENGSKRPLTPDEENRLLSLLAQPNPERRRAS